MSRRRHSAAVYRRRRLVFFFGVLLVLALAAVAVWAVIAQPWASEPSPAETTHSAAPTPQDSSTPTPDETAPSSSPSPSAQETAEGAPPCTAADVRVDAVTDADAYPAGELPELSISLANTGTTDCTIDVGSATQVFTVTSGSDVWWRSTDCQENSSSMVVTLAAGQTVSSAEPVVWDRTRSNVDTCAESNRPRAPGGGASYHVSVAIGGFEGLVSKQILLY